MMLEKTKILVVCDLHWDMSPKEIEVLRQANNHCKLCLCLGDIPLNQLQLITENVSIPTLGILGNHDVFGLLDRAGIADIHGESVNIEGIQIAGIGGSPRYKNESDRPLYSQKESLLIEQKLEHQLPADILISHASPYTTSSDQAHCGLKSISRYMKHIRPLYVLHGHNHEDTQYQKRYVFPKRGRKAVTVICSYRVQVLELNS